MVSSILLLLGAAIGYGLYSVVSGLRKNIAAAKRAGFPYFILRKFLYSLLSLKSYWTSSEALTIIPTAWSPSGLPGRLLNARWVALLKSIRVGYSEDLELWVLRKPVPHYDAGFANHNLVWCGGAGITGRATGRTRG